MPAPLDNVTAARLLKLRVVLTGQGAFRLQPNADAFGALCVLPGSDNAVRLFRGFGGRQLAQLYFPDGRPGAALIDLANHAGFSTLCRTCDVAIWGAGVPARVMPTEIRGLVNAAVISPDPSVAAAVELLWAGGATIDARRAEQDWTPTVEIWRFVRVCAAAPDSAVRAAAEALKAVIRRDRPSAPFSKAGCMLETTRWITRWTTEMWLASREEVRTPSAVWVRLKTRAAIAADAAALGRRAEEFLDGQMPLRLTPGPAQGRGGMPPFAATGPRRDAAAARVTDPEAMDAIEIWSLRDTAGRPRAMACITHGELIVCGPDGRDMAALSAYLAEIVILRAARLPTDPTEG